MFSHINALLIKIASSFKNKFFPEPFSWIKLLFKKNLIALTEGQWFLRDINVKARCVIVFSLW